MEIKEGYAYHIKDSYFDRMQDDKLMKNKEAGNYRPTLYCMKDLSKYRFGCSMKSSCFFT